MRLDTVFWTIVGILIMVGIRIIWNVPLTPLAISFSAGLIIGVFTTIQAFDDKK